MDISQPVNKNNAHVVSDLRLVKQTVCLTVVLFFGLKQMSPNEVGLKLFTIFKVKCWVQCLLAALVVTINALVLILINRKKLLILGLYFR